MSGPRSGGRDPRVEPLNFVYQLRGYDVTCVAMVHLDQGPDAGRGMLWRHLCPLFGLWLPALPGARRIRS